MNHTQIEKQKERKCQSCEHLADGSGVFPDRCSRYEDKSYCPDIVAIERDSQMHHSFHEGRLVGRLI